MTKPSEGSKELKEQLADIEHERWCDWQRWCHQILRQELPPEYLPKLNDVLDRWDRQIITRYDELSEKEKDSDREQVDRYWHLVEAHVKAEIRKTLDKAKEMLAVQGSDGNWNYDPYMHGLYNGMEFVISIIEDREPDFKDAPKQWLSEISAIDNEIKELEER